MNIDFLVKKKLWLAPLAGFTDFSFREICKNYKADVLVSEMISADGLVYNDTKTLNYLKSSSFQKPFGIQIFGSDHNIMLKATKIVIKYNPDFIDINMGCPVKKVVNRNAGSALMKNIGTAQKIVENIANFLIDKNIPISVKFRSGWDFKSINFLEFGEKMQNSGANILCLHPRTRSQMFKGEANKEHIKILKENVLIPVIGNGDIISVQDSINMYNLTKCDSIMIGRGALGKPWIFKQIKTNNENLITNREELEIIKQHYNLCIKDKGNDSAIREMRAHIAYYTKGKKNGGKVRNFINSSKNFNEIIEELELLYER